MKVVFAAVTGQGHVDPLLPLADAFGRLGGEVVFATALDMHDHLAGHGYDLRAAGLTDEQRRAALASRLTDMAPREGMRLAYSFTFPRLHAPPMVDALLAIVDDVQPDLLVCESAEFATPLVARLRGLPWAHHSYGVVRPGWAWELAAEAVTPLWHDHGLPPPERAGMFDGTYLDVCPPALQTAEIDGVPRRLPMRAAAVSDLAPARGRPGRVPHVLATFGTVFNRSPAFQIAVVRALRAGSVDVTLTTGPGVDATALGDLGNIRVVDYMPLADVLPGTDAVITHGGSGTVLATLAHGVPLVIVPRGADHFLNAERVSAIGAGLVVEDLSDLADLAGALRAVLDDPSYRRAAQSVGAQMHAMPHPDDVARTMGSHVNTRAP